MQCTSLYHIWTILLFFCEGIDILDDIFNEKCSSILWTLKWFDKKGGKKKKHSTTMSSVVNVIQRREML